ncbi:MAG: TIGR00730 family Rossman fold protein [Burkholderiaceae bacterium]|jgi:uncharacterized protein (TIGR00730 family)|nr:TIGR00730 family Rossman fold protein [Burkholderiaceae bacterium]
MNPFFSICVYCGSRPGAASHHAQAAQRVGRWIGEHGGQLVYGGGRTGLMGLVAQATRESGGRVVGIIPKSLVQRELADALCDELHIVDTMHERKALMGARSDAFLALPGGIGTLEELFEIWTWRQLGYHDKPVGILNLAGYYDTMLAFLAHTAREGFMSAWQMDLVRVGQDADALLNTLRAAIDAQPRQSELLAQSL